MRLMDGSRVLVDESSWRPRAKRSFVLLSICGSSLGWVGCDAEGDHAASTKDGMHADTVALGSTANTDGSSSATTHAADANGGNSSTSALDTGGMGGHAGGAGEFGAAAPAPKLDGLAVAGVAIELKPAFDPETTRYSVLASDPAADLNVVALADSDLHLEIHGQTAISGVATALPDVSPGSEFVVEVKNDGGERKQYRVVYLPADFPNFHVAARENSASNDPLYLAARSRGSSYVVKLNNDGVPLFYRKTARPSFDFKKHPTAEVSYAEFVEGTTLAEHIVLDETFTEVDRVKSVGLIDTDQHEFLIQPNGNYIVLAYERRVRDLTEFGRGSAELVIDGIWQELSPNHELLFQWNSWNYMSFDESVYMDKDPRDYSHLNSLFVDDDGNWIVSSRGMAQVLKIDRIRGDIIWRLGGVRNDFTFVNDPFGGLCGQHTVSILDNGHLLALDNGQHCYPAMPQRGELTRVVEYAIDEDAMTAELVWSYSREGTYCESQGSAQRLANGNTLIGWGFGTDLMVTEVTADKNIVFELQAQAASGATQSYRAWRFAD